MGLPAAKKGRPDHGDGHAPYSASGPGPTGAHTAPLQGDHRWQSERRREHHEDAGRNAEQHGNEYARPSAHWRHVRQTSRVIEATIITGSATVFINGKPAARNGDTAITCNDPVDLPVGKVVAKGTVFIG